MHNGSSDYCLIPARFWIDFPYKTESISIRHGGTAPRPTTTSNDSKPKKQHVGLILLVVAIELTPFPFVDTDMREGSIYSDEGELSDDVWLVFYVYRVVVECDCRHLEENI